MTRAAIDSPYLTAAEAVAYLKLRTKQALYYHIKENNLPVCRLGSTLRFDRADLDAWVRGTTVIALRRGRRLAS